MLVSFMYVSCLKNKKVSIAFPPELDPSTSGGTPPLQMTREQEVCLLVVQQREKLGEEKEKGLFLFSPTDSVFCC